MAGLADLPTNLPVPVDDGGANHLNGLELPALTMSAHDGDEIELKSLSGLSVIYCYPMTGRPDVPLPEGWDMIPGARGCTPQSCTFRDHKVELEKLGVNNLFGISTQQSVEQAEAAERLHLPFQLLSDVDLNLQQALNLPIMDVGGKIMLKRLTMLIKDSRIIHVIYPVFPPNENAKQVVDWLNSNAKA